MFSYRESQCYLPPFHSSSFIIFVRTCDKKIIFNLVLEVLVKVVKLENVALVEIVNSIFSEDNCKKRYRKF